MTLLNHFLFWIPPLVWNVLFSAHLPERIHAGEAPPWLTILEWVGRIGVLAYALFLPIRTDHPRFGVGLTLYIAGLVIYFASWLLLVYAPAGLLESQSWLYWGPAITPLIFLLGIALMAESWLYAAVSTLFIFFHVAEFSAKQYTL